MVMPKGYKHTDETKRKISDIKKGKPSPYKGHIASEELRRKLSLIQSSPEMRKKKSESLKRYYIDHPDAREAMSGDRNPMKRPEARKKNSETHKKLWALNLNRRYWLHRHHSEETKRKISEGNKGTIHSAESRKMASETIKRLYLNGDFAYRHMKAISTCPNKVELALSSFLDSLIPNEFKYVGDGEFILGGKSPDFLNINGKKQLIELFGDYWHKEEDQQERIDFFKQYGFSTLVIWEHELKDLKSLKEKILAFTSPLFSAVSNHVSQGGI